MRQTYRWFMDKSIELPVNKSTGSQLKVTWKLPAQTFIPSVLHNPVYAGAYVYGRRAVKKVFEEGEFKKDKKPIDRLMRRKSLLKTIMQGILAGKPTCDISR